MNTTGDAPPLESLKFTIRTRDFERAKWFYAEVFGLVEVEAWDETTDRGTIMTLESGGLIEVSEIRRECESYRQEFDRVTESEKMDIQLRTASVDAWAKRLEAFDWPFRGPVDRPWGARYLYLNDPDGVKIILYEDQVVS